MSEKQRLHGRDCAVPDAYYADDSRCTCGLYERVMALGCTLGKIGAVRETPFPTSAGDAREGRTRAAAVEALHRIETGQYCGEPSCPATLQRLAVAGLSGVQPLPECPGHISGAPASALCGSKAPLGWETCARPKGHSEEDCQSLDGLSGWVAQDAPAQVETGKEPTYPCADCGVLRTKAEGGTTFTVCDECWAKHYAAPAPSLSEPGSPPRTEPEKEPVILKRRSEEASRAYIQGFVAGLEWTKLAIENRLALQRALGEPKE